MSLPASRFLAAIGVAVLFAGCATAETEPAAATSSHLDVAAERRFHVSDAEFDPLFVESAIGGDDFTVGTIILEPATQRLEAIIVFGVFPQFYPTTIVRTSTDPDGAVHYEGAGAPERGSEASWSIALVDRGADVSADLVVVLRDGRTTRSHLKLVAN